MAPVETLVFRPEERFGGLAWTWNDFAFVSTDGTTGGHIVKIDLRTFERADFVTTTGRPRARAGVVHGSRLFLVTESNPTIIQIELQQFKLGKTLAFPTGGGPITAFSSSAFVYFTRCGIPNSVHRYFPAALDPAGTLLLGENDACPSSAVVSGESIYLGTQTGDSKGTHVLRLDLPNFTREERLVVATDSDPIPGLNCAVEWNSKLFFGGVPNGGSDLLFEVDKSPFALTDSIDFGDFPRPSELTSVAVDGKYAYFTAANDLEPGFVYKLDMEQSEIVEMLELSQQDTFPVSIAIHDGLAYVVAGHEPVRMVKINLNATEPGPLSAHETIWPMLALCGAIWIIFASPWGRPSAATASRP